MKQAGSKEAFIAVDKDLVVRFAQACLERGARRFVLVSSLGAASSSRSLYLRIKGEAEDAVASLDFKSVAVLRPSLLDAEGGRADGRPGEAIGLAFMRVATAVIGKHHRYAPISVDVVGRAAARLAVASVAIGAPRVQVLESDALHAQGAAS